MKVDDTSASFSLLSSAKPQTFTPKLVSVHKLRDQLEDTNQTHCTQGTPLARLLCFRLRFNMRSLFPWNMDAAKRHDIDAQILADINVTLRQERSVVDSASLLTIETCPGQYIRAK